MTFEKAKKMEKYYRSLRYRWTIKLKRKYLYTMADFGMVTKIDYRHRGVGKTTILLDLAKREQAPILVGTYMDKRLIEDRVAAKGVKVYVVSPFCFLNLRGMEFDNGVYIDESVTPKTLNLIKKHFKVRVRGGFQKREDGEPV